MRTFLFLLLASISLLGTACKSNNGRSSSEGSKKEEHKSYTVSIPENWNQRDTIEENTAYKYITPPSEDYDDMVALNIISKQLAPLTYDEFFKAATNWRVTDTANYTILQNGQIEVNGVISKWQTYIKHMDGKQSQGAVYVTKQGDDVYIITAVTQYGKMDQYKSIFDNIVKSFKMER